MTDLIKTISTQIPAVTAFGEIKESLKKLDSEGLIKEFEPISQDLHKVVEDSVKSFPLKLDSSQDDIKSQAARLISDVYLKSIPFFKNISEVGLKWASKNAKPIVDLIFSADELSNGELLKIPKVLKTRENAVLDVKAKAPELSLAA